VKEELTLVGRDIEGTAELEYNVAEFVRISEGVTLTNNSTVIEAQSLFQTIKS